MVVYRFGWMNQQQFALDGVARSQGNAVAARKECFPGFHFSPVSH
jgi:hypothetical protein